MDAATHLRVEIEAEQPRDLARLAVPGTGSVEETHDPWLPFRLIDPAGTPVEAVSAFFCDLQAGGRSVRMSTRFGPTVMA